tara:strand:- start:2098 stop:2856 length:759 start_codon:yes stop_codon:yes gene_type:complete
MEQAKPMWIVFLLLSFSLAGCLTQTSEDSSIDLVLQYDAKNGTIVESYSNGEHLSTTGVSLDFDFSQTTADSALVSFGIDTNDGRAPVTVAADTGSNVTVEFSQHGIYNLSVYAIDENNKQEVQTLSVRIELRIEWSETNTKAPQTLAFDPTPSNGGQSPIMIEVYSVVENPSLIGEIGGSGQSVQFTWNIADELDDVCQSRSGQVNDGDEVVWNTIHFNTFQPHELRISYDDGQEDIRVNQTVTILYESEE